MTDEKRCEPPGHLRGSDGEHFVCGPNGAPFVALWHAAPHAGIEPLWHNAARTSTGTPAWAANEWGWRYLAHITPPATVAALVVALEAFSVAIPAVLDAADIDASDTVFTVRAVSPTGSRELAQRSLADMLEAARAALALYRGEAGR